MTYLSKSERRSYFRVLFVNSLLCHLKKDGRLSLAVCLLVLVAEAITRLTHPVLSKKDADILSVTEKFLKSTE